MIQIVLNRLQVVANSGSAQAASSSGIKRPAGDATGSAATRLKSRHESDRKRSAVPDADDQRETTRPRINQIRFKAKCRNMNNEISGCSVSNEADSKQEFWDDMTGLKLDPTLVRRAREEEMEEVRKHGIYTKVSNDVCVQRTGRRPIAVRWVDINKGDADHPDYRSRLVAKEINRKKKKDNIFAATPPLEALKMLLAFAVTEGVGFKGGKPADGMKLDFIDVRRAYFHAKARREVYVALPPEDFEEGMCGRLNMSMYGTQDASANWEAEYSEWACSVGFKSSPCIFWHPERNLRMVVHGDDFTTLGYESDLNWLGE